MWYGKANAVQTLTMSKQTGRLQVAPEEEEY